MEIKQALKIKNKKGAALMYTMMFLMLMSVIIVSFSLISVNMYKTTAVSASKDQSFLFAKTIGQVFALQLAEDIDATSIVSYLETNAQSAPTVKGTAKISFNPEDENIQGALNNALKGTGLTREDLTRVTIPNAQLKFYFKTTCARCGATLEDLNEVSSAPYYCQSPTCKNKKVSDKIINKKYLYLDVTVSYNGATEVVTTVFTYLDQSDFTQTMYDLFSVYNIYSTKPSEMDFTFTGDLSDNSVFPNVYLYNGVDSEEEGFGTISRDTYTIYANVKANLTSTGDVKINSKSGTTLKVEGRITSYGSMVLERVNTSDMYMRGDLTVLNSATVANSIYARNNVTIYGKSGVTSVEGSINAMGNVVISGANVRSIVGGSGCNVTLINSTCTSISTGGTVTLTNSTVYDNVVCNGNLTMTDSVITGSAYTKGDFQMKSTLSSRETLVGASSFANVKEVVGPKNVLQVDGNATFTNSSGAKNSAVNGGILIGGSIKQPASNLKEETLISGGINVKGFLKETISGYDCNVCYLIGLNVLGGITLESYSGNKACIPLFGANNERTPSVPAKIAGLIKVNGNLMLGEYYNEIFKREYDNDQLENFVFVDGVPRYINLFGASIDRIYAQSVGSNVNPTQVFIKNGKISGGIIANQVVLSNIEITETAKINATGSTGCVIALDKTSLSGQIVANTAFSLQNGSVLKGTKDGYVHVYGFNSSEKPIPGIAYLDGEVYGELVVGTTTNKGKIYINENAVLGGNDYERAIYINGDLFVNAHKASNITNNPETFAPRLRTQNNNGNKIYLSNGIAHLQGWVYDLYIKDGDVDMKDELSGCCTKPYIKGTTYVETAFVFIGHEGLKDSEGATYTNNNVIVYVYEDTPMLGALTISGTLVVKNGVTLNCKSLKVDKIITEYNGQAFTATNNDIVKQELTNAVNGYDFNSTIIKGLNVTDDTQINLMTSGTITVENCSFGGWVKFKNATGNVVFKNSSVTGINRTTYADANNNYKGCLDVSAANLSLINSYIGGTSSKSNVGVGTSVPYDGNVYCKELSMDGGAIYGVAYTTYASTLKGGAKISNGLHMSIGTQTTVIEWTNITIGKFIYGPNVNVSINNGILCGTSATSSNQATNMTSNQYFVYLNELNMSGSAVLGQYTTVFIKAGTNSAISGVNIGNVYAKTQNLNIFQSTAITIRASVQGFLYCSGNLTYSTDVTPSAGKGLYAGNTNTTITTGTIENIVSGGVNLPNYTGDIRFKSITGNVTVPKANSLVLTGNVTGDIYANNITVENSSPSTLKGNIYVENNMKVNDTSDYLNIGVTGTTTIYSVKVGKALYIYSSSRTVNIYSFVRCGMLAVNFKRSGSDIAITEKSINPSLYTAVTTNSTKYVYFRENVLVNQIDRSSGGNAYLSNAVFSQKSGSSYHGATLYTSRSVLAVRCDFYSAGYTSTTQHAYSTTLGNYNTTSSSYNNTNFGSIVAWLGRNETDSITSYSYGIYLDTVTVKSNITQLESSLSSQFNSATLGESYDERTNNNTLQARNYTKMYDIAGSLTMNNSAINGVIYNYKDSDFHDDECTSTSPEPVAYTLVKVGGNLILNSSRIGQDFTKRFHAHKGFKGIYVSGSMTINTGSYVYINIYSKGSLTNNGSIILQKLHHIDFTTWNNWSRYYEYYCGGEIQSTSYYGSGYNSMQNLGVGVSQYKGDLYYDRHNKKPQNYDWCYYNKDNMKTNLSSSSVSNCPYSLNGTTTLAKAKGFVTEASKAQSPDTLSLNINCETGTAIPGLEWDSTESLVGKIKDPLNYIWISTYTKAISTSLSLNLTSLPTSRLDTSNRTYWYPQAIPLRWYLPTQTTAGEDVSLNGRTNNEMTVGEKKLGESIDALERAQQNFQEIKDLEWWEVGELFSKAKELFNNAGDFFKNLPTLFKPSSSYIGLQFANKEDAYYYRVTAKNINTVLSDNKGNDMMVISRRCMVVNSTFPSGKVLENLIKYVGWNENWVLPTSVTFNQRPVGLVFFNSGVVPDKVFNGAVQTPNGYRKYSKVSTEKDSEGRWYWGDGGNEGWYGTASPANDVVWTFFTCEDPKNPYTSKAKDLHIVLPKNAKMVWEKDKDSCVNIIGNGRVFLYLQEGTDIKVIGNGFAHAFHDATESITNWWSQWSKPDATYNVFGGVRYVATTGSGINERTYYDASGNIVMDEKAVALANSNSNIHIQQQPRMYIIGTGGDISFEVQDFQTAAYVYMPSGYSYGDKSARNTFTISSNYNAEGSGYWDVYGIYVCDNFAYGNNTGTKVRYFKTSPDLSNTSFKRTSFNGSNVGSTTTVLGSNRSSYQLAEFWDYPTDLPVSSMNWYYRGIALS